MEFFVGNDLVSNANLVSTSTRIIKARCAPTFDIKTMVEACGTPWNHNQKQVVTRKPRQRIEELKHWPTRQDQRRGALASKLLVMPLLQKKDISHCWMMNDDGDDGHDDPGEGTKRKATSSASGETETSEELVADEGGAPSPTKRGAEARRNHCRQE